MSLMAEEKHAVVAEGIAPLVRCANPDCNARLGRAHFFGSGGFFEVEKCCNCGEGTRVENTPMGLVVKRLGRVEQPTKKPSVRKVG